MKLKTLLTVMALSVVIASCNKPSGELVGAGQDGNFKEANPYGMVFIKKGSFMMGANTQSAVFEQADNELMVTVEAFWMDETEITNDEYKQFVEWVRDSMALSLIANAGMHHEVSDLDEAARAPYIRLVNGETEDDIPELRSPSCLYGEDIRLLLEGGNIDQETFDYLAEDTIIRVENEGARADGILLLNWDMRKEIKNIFQNLKNNRYLIARGDGEDEETAYLKALAPLFYSDGSLKTTALHYRYSWKNYDQAVKAENKYDVARGCYPPNAVSRVDVSWTDEANKIHYATIERPLREPNDLLTHKIISIYPDTMVWVRDFQYSYNDPLLLRYFNHRGFSEYPVVGVTWEQAHAFCRWRTDYLEGATHQNAQIYRLPTEAEWEYAARGGRKMAAYPWGGNYARDAQGCFLANFKPYRGAYNDDTGTATMKVAQFRPNDFGLFDMAGNVSEWTSSTYTSTNNVYIHDLNPEFQYMAREEDPDIKKRKVVKGGSWKDISAYMQCGARTYEYQYEDRSYIGFRCVRSYIGE